MTKKLKKSGRLPLLLGDLTIDVTKVDDHYSLMELFKRKVVKQWKIRPDEFFDMMQEYLMLSCPKGHLWTSELQRELDELPDHFCRRGKKKEYALMIVKDKKGQWQICYADMPVGMTIDCFSDDKNYQSLLDCVLACKKYLTTRNWKK